MDRSAESDFTNWREATRSQQHDKALKRAYKKYGKAPSLWATKPQKIIHLFHIYSAEAIFFDGPALLDKSRPLQIFSLFRNPPNEPELQDLITRLEALLDRAVRVKCVDTVAETEGLLRLNIIVR